MFMARNASIYEQQKILYMYIDLMVKEIVNTRYIQRECSEKPRQRL